MLDYSFKWFFIITSHHRVQPCRNGTLFVVCVRVCGAEASCGPDLIPAKHRVPDQSISLFSSSLFPIHPSLSLSPRLLCPSHPFFSRSLFLSPPPRITVCLIAHAALLPQRSLTHRHAPPHTHRVPWAPGMLTLVEPRCALAQQLYSRQSVRATVCLRAAQWDRTRNLHMWVKV